VDEEYNQEIDFEKTKSVVLNYFDLLREAKWVVSAAIGSGIFLLIIMLSMMAILPTAFSVQNEKDTALFVLIFASLFAIGLWLPITCGKLLWKILYKKRQKEENILAVQNSLIHRSYLINFEIVTSEGKSQLEKILNHLSLVFPEIQIVKDKLQKKQKTIEDYKKKVKTINKIFFLQNYDLVVPTKTGIFVIKIFEKTVTFDEIEKLISSLNKHQVSFRIFGPDKIVRVVCLAKGYDKFFDTAEFVEKMKNLKRKFRVDLILEEDQYGYSTIWID